MGNKHFDDFKKMKLERSNRELENWAHCVVDVYWDEDGGMVYQVDMLNGVYREASARAVPAPFGEWKPFGRGRK